MTLTRLDPRHAELLQQINLNCDLEPEDLVSEWRMWRPTYKYNHVETVEGTMIDTGNIVGVSHSATDRLDLARLLKIVHWMMSDQYDPKYAPIHVNRHPEGTYYVDNDGTHRAIAHKALGIKRIYADVEVYTE